jgi:hypothetical protein
MTKYTGELCEVRMATTEADLANAPAITNIQSIEWDIEQNIDAQPKGLGQGRLKDVHEGLIDLTGNITRWYDKEPVVPSPGTTTFASMVGAYQSSALTPLYIQVQDNDTGEVHTLKKVRGKYNISKPIDGYQEETYDFSFEELAVAQ